MNDKRWPWLILLPVESRLLTDLQTPSAELHELSDDLRTGFLNDVNALSNLIKKHTQCKSVNIAMLGNVVSDLHCHVIARHEGDSNWPNPVWGFEHAIAYKDDLPQALIETVRMYFRS